MREERPLAEVECGVGGGDLKLDAPGGVRDVGVTGRDRDRDGPLDADDRGESANDDVVVNRLDELVDPLLRRDGVSTGLVRGDGEGTELLIHPAGAQGIGERLGVLRAGALGELGRRIDGLDALMHRKLDSRLAQTPLPILEVSAPFDGRLAVTDFRFQCIHVRSHLVVVGLLLTREGALVLLGGVENGAHRSDDLIALFETLVLVLRAVDVTCGGQAGTSLV